MEKKKLKLSISGSSKKTIDSIEQARTQSKNTVVIEKRSSILLIFEVACLLKHMLASF